jgi:hypothetical protein
MHHFPRERSDPISFSLYHSFVILTFPFTCDIRKISGLGPLDQPLEPSSSGAPFHGEHGFSD